MDRKEKKEKIFMYISCFTCCVSDAMCNASGDTFHKSHVVCHLSLTPTARATDPANSPIMHKDQKTEEKKSSKQQ